ncbi:CPBP family intramembrane metalloprotease [Candidatus Microgenomates bacterium]|nr:CPBP family intramembrane metalloprotease [Candidatus Microgenomates bacterium]
MEKKIRKRVIQILILWGLIAILWGMYRYFFRFSEIVDELIFKPLIFLTPVLWFVKFKERKSWPSLGLTKTHLRKSILIGLCLGLFFCLEGILTSWFKNKELIFNPKQLSIGGIFGAGFLSLITGFSEELLSRGFLMNRFWKLFDSEFLANFLSSVLFTFSHLPIAVLVLYYTERDLFSYSLLIFILSVADGFIFGRTKNISGSIISHALWNWSVILVR